MCIGTAKFLSNFTYSSKEATSHQVVCIVLHFCWMQNFAPKFYIQSQEMWQKATRLFPLGVWSGHETNQLKDAGMTVQSST